MQQAIIDALFKLNNVTTDQGKIRYLNNLQQPAVDLWNSFYRFPVAVDYRRHDIQSVYMLRYFPPYSQIIAIILNAIHYRSWTYTFQRRVFEASFFGCGPSPEIFGFFDFLSSTALRPERINVNTFDINSDHWAFSRNITFESLIPTVWSHCPINYINNNLNLALKNSVNTFLPQLASSNLVVFQNCLNEIRVEDHSIVIRNIKTILTTIPTGAVVLIIDLSNYQAVLDLLAYIEDDTTLADTIEVLRSSKTGAEVYDARLLIEAIPLIVRQNLLTGVPYQIENGLIPRRRINYQHLALRKR